MDDFNFDSPTISSFGAPQMAELLDVYLNLDHSSTPGDALLRPGMQTTLKHDFPLSSSLPPSSLLPPTGIMPSQHHQQQQQQQPPSYQYQSNPFDQAYLSPPSLPTTFSSPSFQPNNSFSLGALPSSTTNSTLRNVPSTSSTLLPSTASSLPSQLPSLPTPHHHQNTSISSNSSTTSFTRRSSSRNQQRVTTENNSAPAANETHPPPTMYHPSLLNQPSTYLSINKATSFTSIPPIPTNYLSSTTSTSLSGTMNTVLSSPTNLPPARSSRSTHENKKMNNNEETNNSTTNTTGKNKKRFLWTEDLHARFISAIFDYGLENATPKILYGLMENTCPPEMTSDHIKSHLQKFRNNSRISKDLFLADFERARHIAEARAAQEMQRTGQQPFPVHFSTYPVPPPSILRDVTYSEPGYEQCRRCERFASLIELGIDTDNNLYSPPAAVQQQQPHPQQPQQFQKQPSQQQISRPSSQNSNGHHTYTNEPGLSIPKQNTVPSHFESMLSNPVPQLTSPINITNVPLPTNTATDHKSLLLAAQQQLLLSMQRLEALQKESSVTNNNVVGNVNNSITTIANTRDVALAHLHNHQYPSNNNKYSDSSSTTQSESSLRDHSSSNGGSLMDDDDEDDDDNNQSTMNEPDELDTLSNNNNNNLNYADLLLQLLSANDNNNTNNPSSSSTRTSPLRTTNTDNALRKDSVSTTLSGNENSVPSHPSMLSNTNMIPNSNNTALHNMALQMADQFKMHQAMLHRKEDQLSLYGNVAIQPPSNITNTTVEDIKQLLDQGGITALTNYMDRIFMVKEIKNNPEISNYINNHHHDSTLVLNEHALRGVIMNVLESPPSKTNTINNSNNNNMNEEELSPLFSFLKN